MYGMLSLKMMNHDYSHCWDYTEKCPKSCFRAQLQRDLMREETRARLVNVPISYSGFAGTHYCPLSKKNGGKRK